MFSSSNNPFWTGENMKKNKERKEHFLWNSLSWIYKCTAAFATNCFSVAGWINHIVTSVMEKVNIFALLLYKFYIFLEEHFISVNLAMFFCFKVYVSYLPPPPLIPYLCISFQTLLQEEHDVQDNLHM